jgi:glycerol-3-phosphate dehydrogenase
LRTLKTNPKITEDELRYFASYEKVIHLDDLLLRRTSIGWLGLIDEQSLEEIAGIVASELKWDEALKNSEIDRVKEIFQKNHSLVIN